MTQTLRYLSQKYEDLNSYPLHHVKCKCVCMYTHVTAGANKQVCMYKRSIFSVFLDHCPHYFFESGPFIEHRVYQFG